jgi:hypothetical protein
MRRRRVGSRGAIGSNQVSQAFTGLGWDNYATDHEDANGQFEQNSTSCASAPTTQPQTHLHRRAPATAPCDSPPRGQ